MSALVEETDQSKPQPSGKRQISLQQLKDELKIFKTKRDQSATLLESVINQVNQKSYYTKDKIQQTLGDQVRPSSLGLSFDEDYLDTLDQLQKVRIDVQNSVQKLSEFCIYLDQMSVEQLPLDREAYRKLVKDIQRQTLLEETICSQLLRYTDISHQDPDQDTFITMIASFRYSPYLNETEIDLILQS